MTSLPQRVTEDMQVRNLAPNTQKSYVHQISMFARHFGKSPEVLGPADIRSYQVYLTNEKKLAPASIIIAVSAFRFLYRVTLRKKWIFEETIPTPRQPQKLPVVLSPEEVLHFLSCVPQINHRTILTCCYAAGLRISEAICLKPPTLIANGWSFKLNRARGGRIAMSCFLQSCWRYCGPGGGESGPRTGCFRARLTSQL